MFFKKFKKANYLAEAERLSYEPIGTITSKEVLYTVFMANRKINCGENTAPSKAFKITPQNNGGSRYAFLSSSRTNSKEVKVDIKVESLPKEVEKILIREFILPELKE